MSQITLTVNGKRQTVDVEPTTPLLYVLRNDLKLKGARYGCGVGQCGADVDLRVVRVDPDPGRS